MQISVNCSLDDGRKTLTLTVESCNTIEDIKATIEDMEGIHPSAQRLRYAFRSLEDRRTLADYNIRNKATLNMFISRLGVGGPYIYVKTSNGNTIRVDFKGLDTVNNVKAKVEENEGIPLDNHRLFFVGKQLEDTRTLYHYGLTEGSSLRLVQLSDASQTTPSSKAKPNTKLKLRELHQPKATEVRPGPSSSELEDLKHQLTTACRKRKELEVTVSKLTHKNKVVSASYEKQLATLETENKKLIQQLIQASENFPSTEQGKAFRLRRPSGSNP